MKSVIGEFELQIDEKPSGGVIRLNDDKGCILRICQIPKDLGDGVDFIDVVYREPQFPEFIKKIDWKLLREQKLALLSVMKLSRFRYYPTYIEPLEGIINLLDALMDYASEDMGLGDKVVFNLPEDDEK